LLVVVPVFAQAPSDKTVAAHVAAAEQLAGPDLTALMVLCKPAPAARPAQEMVEKLIEGQMGRGAPAPGRAFENLYFLGSNWVSAWAIKTSQGIILIDALNNQDEAAALIEGGMPKVGLDPREIKTIIVTHAHGDHYGGALYLQEKYKARVVMSDEDWKQTEGKLEYQSKHWGPVPKRDVTVKDGDKVTLGETTVTTYVTPGHTLGTITPVFDVEERKLTWKNTHRVMLWGGTAFNFGKDVPRLDKYIASAERMAKLAEEQKWDVMLSNHADYDGAIEKLRALEKLGGSGSGQPNPFVMGTYQVTRALGVMGECAKAQRDRFLLN
jgi:metallo-beta-lactamase class B